MSQAKLLFEMISRGHDTSMIVEVAATIIANLELNLAKERNIGGRRHALPNDWTLPDKSRDYALQRGWPETRVETEAKKFFNWACANGVRSVDWFARWRNWCDSRYRSSEPVLAAGSDGANVRPADLRVLRKERMSNAIEQLKLFGDRDLPARPSGGADPTNVVRLPGPGRQRS